MTEINSSEVVVVGGESMSPEAMLDSKREELARMADSEATRGLDPALAAGLVNGVAGGDREASRCRPREVW